MDEEISYHEDGEDVPPWFIALVVFGVCVVVPLVVFLIFGLPFGPEAG